MNNYCTNCGKKLPENVPKCDACNTYVVDLKIANKKKILNILLATIFIIIFTIIGSVLAYTLHYKNLYKSLYKDHLQSNFKEAEFVKYQPCHKCDGSCDGSCVSSPKIIGCYQYYYKSKPSVKNPDIIIFSNQGEISVDYYSAIINKYEFYEEIDADDEYDRKYSTDSRTYLYITADDVGLNNIDKLYEMVNELINYYKKEQRKELEIEINVTNDLDYITISNQETSNKATFKWDFEKNGTTLIDPTLEQVRRQYQSRDYVKPDRNER